MTLVTKGLESLPPSRRPAIQRRLSEARGRRSLQEAARVIEEASELLAKAGLGRAFKVHRSEVRRWEGKEKGRENALPSIDYLRAAAHAFGVEEAHLLAEDVPAFSADDLRRELEERRAGHAAQLRRQATSEQDVARDLLRDRVAEVLGRAARLPPPPRTREALPRDTLSWILDDLQRLFWAAFSDRGLTDVELLERAYELGRLVPTPPRLPPDGFLGYPEIEEARLRRWWVLQAEALRELLRPNELRSFNPDDMNLGRFGELEPRKWAAWVHKWADAPEPSAEEVINQAMSLQPTTSS